MLETRAKLLLVENDQEVVEMLTAYFRDHGYELDIARTGADGVRIEGDYQPNLIILDSQLPDLSGFEVGRRIRASHRIRPAPIIFLIEKRDREELLKGFEVGADDFIGKPFDIQELNLRVRNALLRSRQDTLTNPITNLPDNRLVEEQLNFALSQEDWAALIISIENLGNFREAYGFVASDDVLRAISLMMANLAQETGRVNDFVGHLSPTDFVFLTTKDLLSGLQEKIRGRIDQSLNYFYPIKDRDHSAMHGRLLSIKIGAIKAGEGDIKSAADLRAALLQKKN